MPGKSRFVETYEQGLLFMLVAVFGEGSLMWMHACCEEVGEWHCAWRQLIGANRGRDKGSGVLPGTELFTKERLSLLGVGSTSKI